MPPAVPTPRTDFTEARISLKPLGEEVFRRARNYHIHCRMWIRWSRSRELCVLLVALLHALVITSSVTTVAGEEIMVSAHVVTSGTCEEAGYTTVTSAQDCLTAGSIVGSTGKASDQPDAGYSTSDGGRPRGCTVHNSFSAGSGSTQHFPFATGPCGTSDFNCLCAVYGQQSCADQCKQRFSAWGFT